MERCFTGSATSPPRPPLFKMPLANVLGGEQLKNPFPTSPPRAPPIRLALHFGVFTHRLATRSLSLPRHAGGALGGRGEMGGG